MCFRICLLYEWEHFDQLSDNTQNGKTRVENQELLWNNFANGKWSKTVSAMSFETFCKLNESRLLEEY